MRPFPQIAEVKKIWDKSPHCAFTDLIHFEGNWFCVFREGDLHVGGKNGSIRLLSSPLGDEWNSIALFSIQDIDLRDPKLSITPDGHLMLLAGGTQYSRENSYISSQSRVAFSSDGLEWSDFKLILEPHEWLWKVTWHKGTAYGVAYKSTNLNPLENDWVATLFSSQDGIHYEKIRELNVPNHPSEATIRFLETDEMVLLIRRGGSPKAHAWIGISSFPYQDWTWNDCGISLASPNFLILPDGEMWASGRTLIEIGQQTLEKTVLGKLTIKHLQSLIDLPSGGVDTGYPGMVYDNGKLWISYYSSHENTKTAIYLITILL